MMKEHGFSAVELLAAVTITVVLMIASLGAFNDGLGLNEKASLTADLGQNLQAGANLMVRDFVRAGWGIPTGGVPIPTGAGASPVKRPGPPGTSFTFDPSATTVAAVNAGNNLGPTVIGRKTDIVNILCADNSLPLNQTPLTAISSDGKSMTVDSGTPITGVDNAIRAGDLIMFSNALGNALQQVTSVAGQIVRFEPGDSLNLNQPSAAQGSIKQLQNGKGTYPPTTATRVLMITYYLDTTTDPKNPRLVRQINNGTGQAVALVLEDMQMTFDLVDGVTNPTNVDTPLPPYSPNQIRKVNIVVTGRSSFVLRNTGEYMRRSLTTQVSLRSMSFIDRYR
jgi:Tfp pilus assembly protein PilW